MANNWSIVVPEATVNLNPNPSFEQPGGGLLAWQPAAPDSFNISTEQARSGAYSGKFTADDISAPTGQVRLEINLELNVPYTVHGYVYVPTGAWVDAGNIRFNVQNMSLAGVEQIQQWLYASSPRDEWYYMEARISVTGDGNGRIIIEGLSPDNGSYFYVDDIQIEAKGYPTTFCDGDQDGCRWLGTPHNSHSERDRLSAAGGRQYSLLSDFQFLVGLDEGTGVFPLEMLAQEMPLRPGDRLQGINVQSRNNLLIKGGFEGEDTPGYHAQRQRLIKALNARVGRIDSPPQPRQLVYRGAVVEKEIGVYYVAGLGVGERIGTVGEIINGIQFYAPDPAWYRRGFRGALLDPTDTATFSYVARRAPDGMWDNMSNPSATGTIIIKAIASYGDYIYFAGTFQDFAGISAADRIVRYNRRTGVYTAVGASGANDIINALVVDARGYLYAGGEFTSIGGTSANRVAVWDGTAWSALGGGLTGGVSPGCYALAIDATGALYAGGFFTTAGGGAAANIAKWNGATWAALGSGLNGICESLAVSPDGKLYVGGSFTQAGGNSALRIASWNGDWAPLGGGIGDSSVLALLVAENGLLYAGGSFNAAGGVTVNRLALWNGSAWSGLGGGANGTVRTLTNYNGQIVAGGDFTSIGNISAAARGAIWDGSGWAQLDINLPSSSFVYSTHIDREGYLYLGFNQTGTATYAGQTTVPYEGTEHAYPFFRIRNNSMTDTVRLVSIRNETTGAALLFDYTMLPGESIFLDVRPGRTAVISSMFGSNPRLILPNSDTASFYLTPGNTADAEDNLLTCFVDYAGVFTTPTVVMYWQDTYQSYD